MGIWSDLVVDLLNVIEDELVLHKDKVRIRAVCIAWFTHLPKMPKLVKQLPLLLHPLDNNVEASHGLLNPIDHNVYEIYAPDLQGKILKGSSFGWVATVEDSFSSSPTDINLINPLTREQIRLPPRNEFPDVVRYSPSEVDEEFVIRCFYDDSEDVMLFDAETDQKTLDSYYVCATLLRKIVLLSAPSDECVAVAVYGEADYLAWCRFSDKRWTHCPGISGVVNFIFDCSKLYVINLFEEVFVLENVGSILDLKVTKIASGIQIPRGRGIYLAVCSDGSLLVVTRQFDFGKWGREYYSSKTTGFKVFKLDTNDSTLTEMKNIGGDILFLGAYSSAQLIPSHFLKHFSGFRGNLVYFLDTYRMLASYEENKKKEADVGVFNLEEGNLELFSCLHQPMWPQPIWLNVG